MFQHQHHDRRELRGDANQQRRDRPRHGRGRGRAIERGELRLVLLQMIAAMPLHGHALIEALEDRLGRSPASSPGAIYPTLAMLEDLGYASATTGADGKTRYAVTPRGTVVLDASRATVDAIFARLNAARRDRATPQIRRPLQNLRRALHRRLSQSGLDADRLRALAAVIDAAALDIARA